MILDEYELRKFSSEEEADFSGFYAEISISALPPELFQRKQLISLVCQENSLEAIPAEIAQLEWIENLDLQANYLSEIDPAINQLKHLQRLELSRNQLKNVDFSGLTNLKYLYLSENKLKIFPPSLLILPQLKILYLDSNNLERLPAIPASLGELWVSSNQLNHIEPIDSNSLFGLNLSSNRLKTLPQINAPKLKYLTIHTNEFPELPPAIRELNQLESLALDFKLFDRQQIQYWPHLKWLDLYKPLQAPFDSEAILLEIEQIKADGVQLEKELLLTHPELKLQIHSYSQPRRVTD